MTKRTLFVFAIVLASAVFLNRGSAQGTEGRWAIGLHGGANLWMNDYSQHKVGPGGELMLRYGITPIVSAGFTAGYEELKSQQDVLPLAGRQGYLKLHAIPAAAMLWFHFAPEAAVNPYIYTGLGAMIYKRLNGASTYIFDSKFKSSVLVPVGVGLEFFTSQSTSFVLDLGYRITDDWVDAYKLGKLDGYGTAKAGFNFYLGADNHAAEEQARLDAEARRVRELAEADARRVKELAAAEAEAKRLKDLAAAEADARRLKDLADAEARRLADQKGRDTIIILEKGKTVVLKGVNFEFNKATLTAESEIILQRALRALNGSPELRVLITGHTDNVGSAAYNKKLSFRRAESVKSWLVKNGVALKRLSVAGKGFDEPIDDNTTDAGRANNRRIEFHVLE
jgi:outer membrane protein OmpA-like peptidoglycan-associated protein